MCVCVCVSWVYLCDTVICRNIWYLSEPYNKLHFCHTWPSRASNGSICPLERKRRWFPYFWGSRYWKSYFYGFGYYSNVSCHVPVPTRTARLPVLREADFTSLVVQERSLLQPNVTLSVYSLGFVFWFFWIFFVAGMTPGPRTLVNCIKK